MISAVTIDIIALTALVTLVAGALFWASRRYQPAAESVIDRVDALLPQTQCAQCGYPGCRPYAKAVVAGEAIDLCPPGGADTQTSLARLLGREPGALLDNVSPAKARIVESRCVGCFLCVEACPVDAIVGAPRFMHTVLEDRCTGCELCLPPCPVDCIEMIEEPTAEPIPVLDLPADEHAACIRCGECDPVCPESLPVQQLWWLGRQEDLSQAEAIGLDRCIECGLCNQPCPSGIDLAGTFHLARQKLKAGRKAHAAALLARQHVDERQQRLAEHARIASERRDHRLRTLGEREHAD